MSFSENIWYSFDAHLQSQCQHDLTVTCKHKTEFVREYLSLDFWTDKQGNRLQSMTT